MTMAEAMAGVAHSGGAAVADPVRLVIFDFDGTLSDSGEWFLGVLDDLATRFRFRTVQPDEVETLRGMGSREVIAHLGIPAWKLPLIARHVRRLIASQLDRIQLFPHTPALIAEIAARGYPIAVVTSNAEENARGILGPEICQYISDWECGSSLWGKARKFRRVLKRAGVAPHQALSIGDETRDIEAARSVGLRTGAVLWGYANREALQRCRPDLIFENADAIVEALGGRG